MTEKLAMFGGTPVRTTPWPRWPVYDERDERALVEVLRSGTWGIGGKQVAELEREYADLHHARFAIACCNGTVAIQIALVAAGIEPGDEVITTPYTFMASALAIAAVGAVPVFVDVEPGTHNLDPDQIELAISSRTKGILPVHIGGRPADMDRIVEIANRRGLVVVEDAAQAWGASWSGTPVGTLGAAGTFSFQSSKNVNAGEGGMIVTNDEKLFQRAWSYHNCGRTLGGEWYQHDFPGFNYRLSEFQAGLLRVQLSRFAQQQARRHAAMEELDRGLAGIPGLRVPEHDARVTSHAAHIYMVRFDPHELPVGKPTLLKALQAEGIPAAPGYTVPVYRQKFWNTLGERPTGGGPLFRDIVRIPFENYSLPVCEELCETTIWIKQDALLAGAEAMADVIAGFEKVVSATRAGAFR